MAPPLALIFGESSNDTAALRHLIPALMAPGIVPQCRAVREPGTLSRGAAAKKRDAVAKAIAIVAKHEARSRKVAVVSHEDCDDCEDAHIDRAKMIKEELAKVGVERPVAAAPAWEIESWFMLFPEAFVSMRKCWRPIDFSNRNVGSIENSKEVLRRALRPAGNSKCPEYSESDSERVAQEILNQGLALDDARTGRSKSLAMFRNELRDAFK